MSSLDIFGYTDYRHYLRDYYDLQKLKNRSFSYRQFASRAKLGSPNYLKLVIDGTRRVTDQNMARFVRGLKLTPIEADYFRVLVRIAESKDPEEKRNALARARHLKESAKLDATQTVPLSFKLKSAQLTQFINAIEKMSCEDDEDTVEVQLRLRSPHGKSAASQQGDSICGGNSS